MKAMTRRLPFFQPVSARPCRTAAPLALDGGSLLLRRLKHAIAGHTHPPSVAASVYGRLTDAQEGMRPLDAGIETHDGRADALVRVASVARKVLGLTPHEVQLLAADALLCGHFAEMATGEGKTLATALAAAAAALCGRRVHVVTANDYLVTRDADSMKPLFDALGLSSARIVSNTSPEARQSAYTQRITYATARELAFDALRERLRSGPAEHALIDSVRRFVTGDSSRPEMPSPDMVIIDEADSVLVDDARTPLILAETDPSASPIAMLPTIHAISVACRTGVDFDLDAAERRITLRGPAHARLLGLPGDARLLRHLLEQALAARALFVAERDYLVREGRIELIDVQSGRIAEGRQWNKHLHAFIELKEGCAISPMTRPRAQTTYQTYFSRYRHLCGLSGTLLEIAPELATLFDRRVVRIPAHRPCRRIAWPTRVFGSPAALDAACIERAAALHATGRAVLIGTDSVAHARRLSERLTEAGIGHQRLDARQDADEAAIVARAGQSSMVTVATRMAGRGTDIAIDDRVRAQGGLHVICAQHNPSPRIDRQLIGRCARQGDPGTFERLHERSADALTAIALHRVPDVFRMLWPRLLRLAQVRREHSDRRLRLALLRADRLRQRHHTYVSTGD